MKRTLILHIGHPKTGSTTLQKTLQASRDVLTGAGVLHPNTGRHHNHKVLLPYLTSASSSSSVSDPKSSSEKAYKSSEKSWSKLVSQVDAAKPKQIILSSEQLFRPRGEEFLKALSSNLRPLASHIVIAAYLREPASRTLSSAQQQIKRSPNFNLVPPNYFRISLEPYKEAGLGKMNIRVFDRKKLKGGDIVEDFFGEHLPDFDLEKLTRKTEENTTFSAEAMALLQEVNRKQRTFPGERARFAIEAADRSLSGFSRPRILEDARRAIQARCTDLDWLSGEYGIVFADIDSAAMPRSQANRFCDALDRIEDLCLVDADRKEELWQAACGQYSLVRRFFNMTSRLFTK